MKKSILFGTLAVAIVVGCTNEMLDTSYESVQKEAQLKGDNSMVFSAYVGRGMGMTRGGNAKGGDFFVGTGYAYFDASQLTYECYRKAFGVFAYYTQGNTFSASGSGQGMYADTPSDYVMNMESSSDHYDRWTGDGSSDVLWYKTTKPLDNVQLYYNASSSPTWSTKFMTHSYYYEPAQAYWPAKKFESSNCMTFMAYYPHVNTEDPDYYSSSPKLNAEHNLRLINNYYNTPALDYRVANYDEKVLGGQVLDLMAAKPFVTNFDNSNPEVQLQFKHLLAAVSVKLIFDDQTESKGTIDSPELFFTNAVIQGANNNDKVTKETKFRKRGLFDLYRGKWMFGKDFEPLNLLEESWLLRSNGFITLKNDAAYPLLYADGSESSPFAASDCLDASFPFAVSSTDHLSDDDKLESDRYMFIIPNSNQKKLLVRLNYIIKSGSSMENVDLDEYLDLKIEPGKVYQILLRLKRDKLKINATVNNWDLVSHYSLGTNGLDI